MIAVFYSSSCALASTAHEQLWLLYLAGYPTPRGPEPYPSSLWADLLQVHSSCVLVAQDDTTVYTPHTTTQHSWGIMLGKGDMRQSGHTRSQSRDGRSINQNLLLLLHFGAQPHPAPSAIFLTSPMLQSSPAPQQTPNCSLSPMRSDVCPCRWLLPPPPTHLMLQIYPTRTIMRPPPQHAEYDACPTS